MSETITIQHDDTGRTTEWPKGKPLPSHRWYEAQSPSSASSGELARCPFCGRQADEDDICEDGKPAGAQVICDSCCGSGPWFDSEVYPDSRQRAAHGWNERAAC